MKLDFTQFLFVCATLQMFVACLFVLIWLYLVSASSDVRQTNTNINIMMVILCEMKCALSGLDS